MVSRNSIEIFQVSHLLHFLSAEFLELITSQAGFSLDIIGSKTYSSNTYFLIKKSLQKAQDA